MRKRLVRTDKQKMVAGVLGGLANYFSIEVTIIRLLFVVALIFTQFIPLALLYVAGVFIMPHERDV